MSELRIIGGKARGRRIRSVPGDTTRPITDKVREALFNIIGPDIQGGYVLDLFSGTGSVGIEALSRGAQEVYFLDKNKMAISTIRQNLKTTGLDDGATVVLTDAFSFLGKPPGVAFDYVYVAPPQYKGLWKKALRKIDERIGLISEDAWVIVQIHPVEYEPIGEELPVENMIEFDQRQYGSTVLVFYRRP